MPCSLRSPSRNAALGACGDNSAQTARQIIRRPCSSDSRSNCSELSKCSGSARKVSSKMEVSTALITMSNEIHVFLAGQASERVVMAIQGADGSLPVVRLRPRPANQKAHSSRHHFQVHFALKSEGLSVVGGKNNSSLGVQFSSFSF